MEEAVYAPLAGEMKEFVLTMCIFDSFTYEQALYMGRRENTAGLLAELTRRNAFVTYDRPGGIYRLHSIFSGFLKEIFFKEDTARRQDLYRRAAQWYQSTGEHAAARRYFYQCRDFDGILLSLEQDRSNDYSAENKELLLRKMLRQTDNSKPDPEFDGLPVPDNGNSLRLRYLVCLVCLAQSNFVTLGL